MKIAIIQEAIWYVDNWEYRESQCLMRAINRLGEDAACFGVGYGNITDSVLSEYDCFLILEQYDDIGWLPIDKLRNCKKPKFYWSIDSHCNIDSHKRLCGKCCFDVIYCSNLRDVPMFQKLCTLSQWLPNAFSSDLINTKPDIDRPIKIGYCGSLGNPQRQDMIRQMRVDASMRTDINVIGDAMVSALSSYQISWNRNISYDINYRTFESMGAGAMLITNITSGTKLLFDDQCDCVYYTDIRDCIDKAKYYMEHDEERLKIARAGHTIAHDNHTYDKRAEQIIKMFKEFA